MVHWHCQAWKPLNQKPLLHWLRKLRDWKKNQLEITSLPKSYLLWNWLEQDKMVHYPEKLPVLSVVVFKVHFLWYLLLALPLLVPPLNCWTMCHLITDQLYCNDFQPVEFAVSGDRAGHFYIWVSSINTVMNHEQCFRQVDRQLTCRLVYSWTTADADKALAEGWKPPLKAAQSHQWFLELKTSPRSKGLPRHDTL